MSCLCEGLLCRACGKGRIHHPISDYYDEATGQLIHVPYFAGMRLCPECGARDWQTVGEIRPEAMSKCPEAPDPSFASPRRSAGGPSTMRDPARKVMLRDEQDGPDRRYLWAYLTADGALHIDGQDLGPATAPVSADGEYEWFQTIRSSHLPRLVELLGGEPGTGVLDLLAERYTGTNAAELERVLRETGLPVELFVS